MAEKQQIDIAIGGTVHRNLLVSPDGAATGQAVLIFPDWLGRTIYQEKVAERLAAAGFTALCVDVYGEGRFASDPTAAEALMTPLASDRESLTATLAELAGRIGKELGLAPRQLSLIGFCFGGLCALDLARTGEAYALSVSFHGTLDPHPTLQGRKIGAPVAIFHGWHDPVAAPLSLNRLLAELAAAGADWQSHCFGRAVHAFMMEHADAPEHGIAFDPGVSEQCWEILMPLLERAHGAASRKAA